MCGLCTITRPESRASASSVHNIWGGLHQRVHNQQQQSSCAGTASISFHTHTHTPSTCVLLHHMFMCAVRCPMAKTPHLHAHRILKRIYDMLFVRGVISLRSRTPCTQFKGETDDRDRVRLARGVVCLLCVCAHAFYMVTRVGSCI